MAYLRGEGLLYILEPIAQTTLSSLALTSRAIANRKSKLFLCMLQIKFVASITLKAIAIEFVIGMFFFLIAFRFLKPF